ALRALLAGRSPRRRHGAAPARLARLPRRPRPRGRGQGPRRARARPARRRPRARGGRVVVLHRRAAPRRRRQAGGRLRAGRGGARPHHARERARRRPRGRRAGLPRAGARLPGREPVTEGRSMKGETVVVNGDEWTVVDEAPAAALAEMVAALLEDEGFVVMVRGLDLQSDAVSHLGAVNVTATQVLVPKDQA